MPLKDSLSKIGKSISDGAATAAKKSSNLVEITKMNMIISGEDDKIKGIYTEIGALLQKKHENGEEFSEDLLALCNKVDGINDNIENLRNKIIELKNILVCPGCGNELSTDILFCPKCGTKQLQPKSREED